MSLHQDIKANFAIENYKKNIILDCDGVMLDWIKQFKLYCQRVLRLRLYGLPSSYNLAQWIGVDSKEEALAFIDKFNKGDGDLFNRIPPLPFAVDALKSLHQNGHSLHILTACPTDQRVVHDRHDNVSHYFGPIFSSITHVGMHEKKLPYLKQHKPSIWVEDNFENALAGVEAGHETFLIRCSSNLHKQQDGNTYPFTWINDLREVEHHLSHQNRR